MRIEFGEDREARCRNLADTAVRIHFSGMRKVPTWRYGRRRDIIRSIWIRGISRRMISAWQRIRGCSKTSNLEMDNQGSPGAVISVVEIWDVSFASISWYLRCVHFLFSTSISSTASILLRSEDYNRTTTVNTFRVLYLEAATKKLWARCEKRQIVRSQLRHTLNTKHWAQTGNRPQRQVHWTKSIVNRAYHNSTEQK